MLLAKTLRARAGAAAIRLGHRITGYENNPGGTVTVRIDSADGATLFRRRALHVCANCFSLRR